MNVLITGVTGFIGKRLSERLTANGHTISGLSRNPDSARARMPEVATFYPWNPAQLPPQEAIEGADAVVHLAGETVNGRWTAAKKQRILTSREVGTRNLVTALASAGGGKTLISTSAVGYYGDRGDAELTERSAAGAGFLAGVTQAWEREARQAEQAGCRVAIMRLGIVLAAEGGALGTMLPLFRFGLGGPLGSGRQWWAWVHIDDVTAAIETALTSDRSGTYNVTSPQPVRQRDFARALGQVLHRPALAPVPALVLRLVQGQFADEILFSKRVLPERLEQSGFQFRYPSIRPALSQLLS